MRLRLRDSCSVEVEVDRLSCRCPKTLKDSGSLELPGLDRVRLWDAFQDWMPHAAEIGSKVGEEFESAAWDVDVWKMSG
jgi:hypothetical protein